MPKQKTRKAVAKRMRLTKNGKVMRGNQKTRHLLASRSAKRRRNLRRVSVCAPGIAKNLAMLLDH
ncbi:MAG: 50S ribosomal protein L35 [Planctomycetota bacterium]|nr:50S ribosomal protein L35 [Planctomycetota bacterium]